MICQTKHAVKTLFPVYSMLGLILDPCLELSERLLPGFNCNSLKDIRQLEHVILNGNRVIDGNEWKLYCLALGSSLSLVCLQVFKFVLI